MEVRVYDCRDLLRMEAPPGADRFITLPAASSGGMFAVEDKVVLGPSSNQPQPSKIPRRAASMDGQIGWPVGKGQTPTRLGARPASQSADADHYEQRGQSKVG